MVGRRLRFGNGKVTREHDLLIFNGALGIACACETWGAVGGRSNSFFLVLLFFNFKRFILFLVAEEERPNEAF